MQLSVHSNIGKKRSTNQDYADYFKSSHGQYLFVLCDGVGGHQAGEVASELTVKFLGSLFLEAEEKITPADVSLWIDEAINQVNTYIYGVSLTQHNLAGMGTTLIMALTIDDKVYIAHVGDSRAYAYSDRKLIQLTEDHSLVNELIRSGEITEEEGSHHPRRNVVTQSIGVTEDVKYELNEIGMEDVERLMLCSDGLTNMLTLNQLTDYFIKYDDIDVLADNLIEGANKAGGSDNITIILASNFNYPIESAGEER